MKKLNLVNTIILVTVLLSGCKLNQMVKLAEQNELKIKPSPLEVHGGNVPFEINAVLPPKILPTSTSFTINFAYSFEDQEIDVGSMEFNSSDYPNSANAVSEKTSSFTIPYRARMHPGTLYMKGVAKDTRNGKFKETERKSISNGLVLTSLWVQDVAMSSYAPHNYNDQEELIPTYVNFYFDQGRSNLRTSLSYGGVSNKSKRDNLSAFIAEKNVTRTVTITGTHSPEGTETVNSNLSEDRAGTIEKYYRNRMDRYDYKGASDSIEFILKPIVQDWSAFKDALSEYDNVEAGEKEMYYRVINGNGTFEEKEKEIQKIPSYKSVFKNVYPGLRSAKTEVLTVKPKKSNPQIAFLSKSIIKEEVTADILSNEELLFSATLTPSVKERSDIYKVATKKIGSWVAHNNLGVTYLRMNQLDDAATQLEIALNKNTESALVQSNLAAVRSLQGNHDQAYEILQNISNGSNEIMAKVNAMKGAIEVRQANYKKAQESFRNSILNDAANIDRGLAHLLDGDYSQADEALNLVDENGDMGTTALYLLAVSAAKQSNRDDVASYLSKAVSQDASLKDKVINDLEFANFANEVNQAIK